MQKGVRVLQLGRHDLAQREHVANRRRARRQAPEVMKLAFMATTRPPTATTTRPSGADSKVA
jgi:hypothetical protein